MSWSLLVMIHERSNLAFASQVILQGGGTLHLPTTSDNLMEKRNVCIYFFSHMSYIGKVHGNITMNDEGCQFLDHLSAPCLKTWN